MEFVISVIEMIFFKLIKYQIFILPDINKAVLYGTEIHLQIIQVKKIEKTKHADEKIQIYQNRISSDT